MEGDWGYDSHAQTNGLEAYRENWDKIKWGKGDPEEMQERQGENQVKSE